MEYNAINIGTYDLVAGIPFLQNLSFLPWVSANFYDAAGQPLFQPYIIKSIIDLNIGIIGLSPDTDQHAGHIQYQSWQEALPPLLAELEKKTDLIIVLSSLAMTENENIALNFPSVRIIFSAVTGNRNVPIRQENEALLTQTMDRGRYLGYLFLQNPQMGKWQERSSVANEKNQQRTLRYRLQRINTILQRQKNMSDPNRKQLLEEKEKLKLQLKNRQHQSERVAASYFYRNIPIRQNIKQNEKIQRMLQSIEK